MRDSLRRDLTVAMKNRDQVAVTALRSALAAIENAEASSVHLDHSHAATDEGRVAGAAVGVGATDVDRRTLTRADLRTILGREVSERSATAEEYETARPRRSGGAAARRGRRPASLPGRGPVAAGRPGLTALTPC